MRIHALANGARGLGYRGQHRFNSGDHE